jgi:hypothetical protein
MVLASSPSFWDVVWWICIFMFWVMWIFVVISVFLDNFRRRDHGGFAKALWTVVIVFFPILGVVVYLIARPSETDVAVF